MRSIYHSVGRCFFAVYLLVTMTKSALGPRLGFRGYPKVNTLGVKCFRRKVYATLGVSCYLSVCISLKNSKKSTEGSSVHIEVQKSQ